MIFCFKMISMIFARKNKNCFPTRRQNKINFVAENYKKHLLEMLRLFNIHFDLFKNVFQFYFILLLQQCCKTIFGIQIFFFTQHL